MRARDTYVDPSSAATYTANSSVQFGHAEMFVMEHLSKLRGNILDVGSGTGKVTKFVQGVTRKRVRGLDISSGRVAAARDSYLENPEITFCVGDIVSFSPLEKYQAVVSFNTLHHIPEGLQLDAFFRMKDLLNDANGVALLMIPGQSKDLHASIHEAAVSERFAPHFRGFNLGAVRTYETPDYYEGLCKKAGFYYSVVTSKAHQSEPCDFSQMRGFLSGWLPHLAYLISNGVAEKEQGEFLDAIVTAFFARMGKKVTEKVVPEVVQNKVVAYATRESFLFFLKKNQDCHKSDEAEPPLRAHL